MKIAPEYFAKFHPDSDCPSGAIHAQFVCPYGAPPSVEEASVRMIDREGRILHTSIPVYQIANCWFWYRLDDFRRLYRREAFGLESVPRA